MTVASKTRTLTPALVVLDCVALFAAWLIARPGGVGSMLLLSALIVGGNTAAGLYQLPIPLWRPLLPVVGVALVAGSLVTTARTVLDLPVQEGPLTVAVVFAVLSCIARVVVHLTRR